MKKSSIVGVATTAIVLVAAVALVCIFVKDLKALSEKVRDKFDEKVHRLRVYM